MTARISHGLLSVIGQAPAGKFLPNKKISAKTYMPIAVPIIRNPLLKYENTLFFMNHYLTVSFLTTGN